MADITLSNTGIQNDIDNMNSATRTMQTAIQDFTQLVNANIDLLAGKFHDQLVKDFQNFQTVVGQVNSQFQNGTQVLGDMTNQINSGDTRAASIMGS
jgi:uncharacterized protein YukE